MPIPRRNKAGGSAGTGSEGSGTRYHQLYMQGMSSSAPQWEAQAACRGKDPELFFFEGVGSEPRLREMAAFCKRMCRFREECFEAADEADRYYSVRGGRLPEALKSGGKTSIPQKVVFSEGKPIDPPVRCKRGHEREWVVANGSKSGWRGYCYACERERRDRTRADVALSPAEAAKAERTCQYGHETAYRDPSNTKRCKTCESLRHSFRRKNGGSSVGWNANLKA